MAKGPTISVEEEQKRSPLLEAVPRPEQAALAVKGQKVVVVEQRWMVCRSQKQRTRELSPILNATEAMYWLASLIRFNHQVLGHRAGIGWA